MTMRHRITCCLPPTPIERLELSSYTLECLKRAHINSVGEPLEMSDDELLRIYNFENEHLVELREKLVRWVPAKPGKEAHLAPEVKED